ncbi:MAG: Hint domain-containing protein [Pseudomonadota bacterium]
MSIGEAGTLTRGGFTVGEVIRIDFEEPLVDAVVHLSSSNFGGNEFSLRVLSVDANGFTFTLEEWEDEDGPHPASEQITWLAIETGVHTLPDGRVIEAGTTTATTTASTVSLTGDFDGDPTVLTNVMSQNETDVVDSDPFDISESGFSVQLQEGSDVDGVHIAETVGFIAIDTGGDGTSGFATIADGLDSGNNTFALGGALTDGAVFAETQTLNEDGAGNVAFANTSSIEGSTGTITLRFDEETGDGNAAHGDETVGIVGFELGRILCLTSGTMVGTENGSRMIDDLAPGDRLLTAEGVHRPLRRIYRRKLELKEFAADERLRPVRITAGALGAGLPQRDLLVSRQHRMLVSSPIVERMFGVAEVLISAILLTALPGVYVDEEVEAVEYIHLLFDKHEVVFAEGAPTESLYTGAEALKSLASEAREEILSLFPDLRRSGYVPPSARAIPMRRLQRRLVERHAKNAKPLLTEQRLCALR